MHKSAECHGESETSNDIIGQPGLQPGCPSQLTQVKSPPAGVTDVGKIIQCADASTDAIVH